MKRYFLLNHFYSLCIILTLSAGAASAQDENDFYKDSIHLVDKTVNLVTDYGANGNDSNDDSPPLQTAVDDMTALTNGGKVIIPSGTFYLIDIKLKDNVHLVIDSNATIVPFTS